MHYDWQKALNQKCDIINKLKKRSKDTKTLELIEKTILSTMYVCQINERNFTDRLKEKNMLSEDQVNEKIDDLIEKNLVNKDRITLTEIGRNSLHVVLAGGVFDIIHPGHISTLNAAKALGDVLVVVVATDNTAVKMKKRNPLHSQEQRQELVKSLKVVDLCLIGQENDIFKKLLLTDEEWKTSVEYAQKKNIFVFADVYGDESFKLAQTLKVDGYKIHAEDTLNTNLIKNVIKTNKIVL